MRRNLITLVMAAALITWGSIAWAGIQHTVHNLMPGSNGAWQMDQFGNWSFTSAGTADNGTTAEICIYCHTPHQSNAGDAGFQEGGAPGAPIWNRTLSTATYVMYSSPTFDSTRDSQPTGVSKACLSCHDGTVGINQLVNNRGSGVGTNPANAGDTRITNTPGGGGNNDPTQDNIPYLGLNLQNDHPISMQYFTAKSPNGSYTNQTNSGESVTATDPNSGFKDPGTDEVFDNGIRLYVGKVQCASHHDPHNSGNPTFLRVSNDGSQVCLTCHRKDN